MLASVWYFLWACCGGCVVSAILMGMQWHFRVLLSYIYRELALWRLFQVFWLSSFVNYLLKSSAWFSKCHWELQIDLCCYCYYNLLYCYYLKGRKRDAQEREFSYLLVNSPNVCTAMSEPAQSQKPGTQPVCCTLHVACGCHVAAGTQILEPSLHRGCAFAEVV